MTPTDTIKTLLRPIIQISCFVIWAITYLNGHNDWVLLAIWGEWLPERIIKNITAKVK